MLSPLVGLSEPLKPAYPRDGLLMERARELETAFLSEMLSFSGLGTVSEGFGGGAGEEQFASFLRQEQAKLMVDKGGIGLAEVIFDSLKSREEQHNGTK